MLSQKNCHPGSPRSSKLALKSENVIKVFSNIQKEEILVHTDVCWKKYWRVNFIQKKSEYGD